jgi:Domain of unknown function (DUF5666)
MVRRGRWVTAAVAGILFVSGAVAALGADAGSWSGTVEVVAGDDLALVGVPAHFRMAGSVTEMESGRTLAAQTLAPGTSVTLRVGDREADGRLRADGVVVQAKSPLSVTGAIGQISDDRTHIEVQGVEIELDHSTGFSGRGDAGALRSARDLRSGAIVSASLVPTTSGTLRASQIRATPTSREPGEDQELKGFVTAVGDTAWTIDAKVLAITDQTVFEGDPAVGDFVEAKFHDDGTGNLVADRIEKEDGAGVEVEFMGIVEAIGDASWTISGQVLAVTPTTQILGSPAVGDSVEVHAVKAADGSLTASKIKKEDARGQEAEFSGTVETIAAASWQIAGQTVLVNAATRIDGNPAVGDTVEVKAQKAADGTLTATRIQKDDSGHGNGNDNGNGGDDNGGNTNGGGQSGSSGSSGSSGGSSSSGGGSSHHGHGSDDGIDN